LSGSRKIVDPTIEWGGNVTGRWQPCGEKPDVSNRIPANAVSAIAVAEG